MPKRSDDDENEGQPEEEQVPNPGQLTERAILILAGEIQTSHLGICYELLNFHYKEDFNDPITLLINSPGGNAAIGWAIVDVMNFVRVPVHTVCIGLAASMAADIFVNGDVRTMGQNSTLMIHPHFSNSTGSHHKLIANIKGDIIEHNRRVQHYVTNSKYESAEEVEQVLLSTRGEDLWLNPQECLDHGLADAIATNNKKNKRRKHPALGSDLVQSSSETSKNDRPRKKSRSGTNKRNK